MGGSAGELDQRVPVARCDDLDPYDLVGWYGDAAGPPHAPVVGDLPAPAVPLVPRPVDDDESAHLTLLDATQHDVDLRTPRNGAHGRAGDHLRRRVGGVPLGGR